ncbi:MULTISPECIES: hypothetical protein [Aquimarina]|uniref:hypothetical protein n=1 Tax=Aquimarina TaxID=290174 RepID=UPI001F2641BA|nr:MULTISPECIES: hypothetical protein [Aquimarina]
MKKTEKCNIKELNTAEMRSIDGGNWIEEYIQYQIEKIKDLMREAGVFDQSN